MEGKQNLSWVVHLAKVVVAGRQEDAISLPGLLGIVHREADVLLAEGCVMASLTLQRGGICVFSIWEPLFERDLSFL